MRLRELSNLLRLHNKCRTMTRTLVSLIPKSIRFLFVAFAEGIYRHLTEIL